MRRRLVMSTIAIVLVVLGALAVPVGLVVYNSGEDEIRGRLEAEAVIVTNKIAPDLIAGVDIDLFELISTTSTGDGLRVFDANGTTLVDTVGTSLVNPISVRNVGPNGTTIELFADRRALDDRFREQLTILLTLAGGALLASAALAAVQARQLARPLERVAGTAARLGDGDFSKANPIDTGIPEIDRISAALDESGARIDRMLKAERHFTADATHQLRTGLTGIAMRFELLTLRPEDEVKAEAEAGLNQTEQLNQTIDELLAVTRHGSTQARGPFDLMSLVDDHITDWLPHFSSERRTILAVTIAPSPVVFGTKGLAGQVIDILISNSLRHGRGNVSVIVEGPSVTVTDQGTGVTDEQLAVMFDGPVDPAARHGRGLPLARRLAQVDGASLNVVSIKPLRIKYSLVRA